MVVSRDLRRNRAFSRLSHLKNVAKLDYTGDVFTDVASQLDEIWR